MIVANIQLGQGVFVDPSSSINNVVLGDKVKIAKNCSVFGSETYPLAIGAGSYVGPNSFIQGFAAPVTIGERVSIAQSVNIMSNSGPNASPLMQRYFPLQQAAVSIGDDCWLGTNVVVMPGVVLGRCCVVAANSFVNKSFEPYSVIGGNPARLLRKLEPLE
ncbi:acyltransferase [Hymenobacter sp. B81]|uniref:acyltransferase n=1 Tax=Hymenobacter sp. B81 TaxID=3344878 RepID=UPI0037DBF781